MHTILARNVAFQFSQAITPLFSHINFSLTTTTHALVGQNGVGKSIFLQLLAGKRDPSVGQIVNTAKTGYMPQHTDFGTQLGADFLGLTGLRRTYQAICSGQIVDMDDFPWDFEKRIKHALAQVELSETILSRPCNQLSGGEQTKLKLALLLKQDCSLLLLDEPSNHLDTKMRQWLATFIRNFSGQSLIVTHDITLLDIVDTVSELTPKAMYMSNGGWADYQVSRTIQLDTLDQRIKQHKTALRKATQQRQVVQTRQVRKSQQAKRARKVTNQSKTVLNFKAGQAEKTQSRLVALYDKRVMTSKTLLSSAQDELEDCSPLAMNPKMPISQRSPLVCISELVLPFGQRQPINLTLSMGDKLIIDGDNGSGKSTLLRIIMNELMPISGHCQVTTSVKSIDQHLTLLNNNVSALHNFQRLAPSEHWHESDYRTILAKLRLRGDKALMPVRALSGGERLKVALACVFLGETVPALLLLDEPDNHLDLESKALLAR